MSRHVRNFQSKQQIRQQVPFLCVPSTKSRYDSVLMSHYRSSKRQHPSSDKENFITRRYSFWEIWQDHPPSGRDSGMCQREFVSRAQGVQDKKNCSGLFYARRESPESFSTFASYASASQWQFCTPKWDGKKLTKAIGSFLWNTSTLGVMCVHCLLFIFHFQFQQIHFFTVFSIR